MKFRLLSLILVAVLAEAQAWGQTAEPAATKPVAVGVSDGKTTLGLTFIPPGDEGWKERREGLSVSLLREGPSSGENAQIEAYLITLDAPFSSTSEYVERLTRNTQEGYAASKQFKVVKLEVEPDQERPRCAKVHLLLEDVKAGTTTSGEHKWSEQYVLSCAFTRFPKTGAEIRYYSRYLDTHRDAEFPTKVAQLFKSVVIKEN